MDDLISRAAALDVLVTSPNFNTTLTRIEELPAVDAAPVVRCRDCKYYGPIHDDRGRCNARSTLGLTLGLNGTYYSHNVWTQEDKFCSDGERRESE